MQVHCWGFLEMKKLQIDGVRSSRYRDDSLQASFLAEVSWGLQGTQVPLLLTERRCSLHKAIHIKPQMHLPVMLESPCYARLPCNSTNTYVNAPEGGRQEGEMLWGKEMMGIPMPLQYKNICFYVFLSELCPPEV